MTNEGNEQVKESKALALIQKYESFGMKYDEMIEEMFSRSKNLVARIKVLNKGFTTSDHVKKIIRSLPKKWRPMVTTLKVSKDLNNMNLEELINSLRSHEIYLEEDNPQKKVKFVPLKSNDEPKKAKALQTKEEKYEEISKVKDKLSLLSRRVNQLWK